MSIDFDSKNMRLENLPQGDVTADSGMIFVPDQGVLDHEEYFTTEGVGSRALLDYAFVTRDAAAGVEKVDGEALKAIQRDAKVWLEDSGALDIPKDPTERYAYFTQPSEDRVRKGILGFTDFLAGNFAGQVSAEEIEATRAFVEAAFASYNDTPADGKVMKDADGSFGFVVPVRTSEDPVLSEEYGGEIEPVIPVFRYIPHELRSKMLAGLPPVVIDTYRPDEYNKHGYLVFAPVTADMATHLPGPDAFRAVRENVNNAVNFARRRFGVNVVGLGATLPGLTRYGQLVDNEDVIVTTGHGGTLDIAARGIDRDLAGTVPRKIGILGQGAIGGPMAHYIAERFPDSGVTVYDKVEGRKNRTVRDQAIPGRIEASESEEELIESCDVIISAIVGRISLKGLDLSPDALKGTLIYDDSMPGCFDRDEVEALGGSLLWVIGEDIQGETAVRRGYDYGTLLDMHTDVFGCEAEAATLSRHMSELEARGIHPKVVRGIMERIAIRAAVTAEKARIIGLLFDRYGITAARQPQSAGKPVSIARAKVEAS